MRQGRYIPPEKVGTGGNTQTAAITSWKLRESASFGLPLSRSMLAAKSGSKSRSGVVDCISLLHAELCISYLSRVGSGYLFANLRERCMKTIQEKPNTLLTLISCDNYCESTRFFDKPKTRSFEDENENSDLGKFAFGVQVSESGEWSPSAVMMDVW